MLWALHELGHMVLPLAVGNELAPIRDAIESWRPDITFNLLLHFHDIVSYDAYVVSYLELLKQPYTGCNPRGLSLASDKALAKKILTWHRIAVPRFDVFRRGQRVTKLKRLDFPMFVKSTVEHASFGISQASVVRNEEALRERVDFVHGYTGTDAIVEEYIRGRELNVGVLGNARLRALPVWEMRFEKLPGTSEPIATSRVKWNLAYQKKIGVATDLAADLEPSQVAAIQRLPKRVFRALSLSGYARMDLRLTPEGKIWVLEANPNPDLSMDEDFGSAATALGLDCPALVERILRLGLRYRAAWKES